MAVYETRVIRRETVLFYYFAGPLGLTMAIQGMLDHLGINENDMRSEEFYGY